MQKQLLTAVLFGSIAASACNFSKPKATDTLAEPAESAARDTQAADIDSGAAVSASASADAGPAKPTKEELDKALSPPAGLVDLRPIIGTDPDEPLPAMFASVKKGMTAKELDAIFPGVGAYPKIAYLTFTKQGAKWIRVVFAQKHKDILDLAYDDAGGVKEIGFMFDPATAKPELWDYLQQATRAKWGAPDSEGDLQIWKPAGVKMLSIHKSGAAQFSISIQY